MARRFRFSPVSLALGYAFAASLGHAADAPTPDRDGFGIKDLPSGYQVASSHGDGEGKCGEGKCGGEKKPDEGEGKCGEGKCGDEG